MFQPDSYLSSLTTLLQHAYQERLLYVGLQGSYLRNEATETSDIDIMVVIRDMTPADLDAYRHAIHGMPDVEQSCGFICGADELRHWNPLEICHLLHTTKDFYGHLHSLVPAYTTQDVHTYVQLSLGNLYHELCHRYVHAPHEENVAALPGTYKAVFFILQNLHYLRTGCFIGTKAELLHTLSGMDQQVLETAMALRKENHYDFDKAFHLLLHWCQETLRQL